MTADKTQSILIMGAGPASIFTACGLYDLGFKNITVISRPRKKNIWEGISARVLTLLEQFSLHHTLKTIGAEVQREAHWNGIHQAQNREFIIQRDLFDKALLQDIKDKGVNIREGRITRTKKQDQGWKVDYESQGQTHSLHADFLIEARGREAKLHKQKKNSAIAPTTALCKTYSVIKDKEALTAVASFETGWAWFLRDGQGNAALQIFINSDKGSLPAKDTLAAKSNLAAKNNLTTKRTLPVKNALPVKSTLAVEGNLDDFYHKTIAQIPMTAQWLEDTQITSAPLNVRTAAAQRCDNVIGDDFIYLGDASMALDPLSGNGIFYAIGSALAAIPVIHTILCRPDHKKTAMDFYHQRVDHLFEKASLTAQEFYRTETRWPKSPFWAPRSIDLLGTKASPKAVTAEKKTYKIKKMPVVKQGFIAEEELIITPDHPRGIWLIDHVPVAELLKLKDIKSFDRLKTIFNVSDPQLQTAFRWLDHLLKVYKADE